MSHPICLPRCPIPDWCRKKKNIIRGNSVVIPTANALYCNRIASTNSVGRYLIAKIEIAEVIIIAIFLSLPNVSFRLRTVYVTKNINRNKSIFAKKSSSKLSRLNTTSDRNWTIIIIISFAPSANRSNPSTGPALASEENIIVRNVNIPPFLFIVGLDD